MSARDSGADRVRWSSHLPMPNRLMSLPTITPAPFPATPHPALVVLRCSDDVEGAAEVHFAIASLSYADVQHLLAAIAQVQQLRATFHRDVHQLRLWSGHARYYEMPASWADAALDETEAPAAGQPDVPPADILQAVMRVHDEGQDSAFIVGTPWTAPVRAIRTDVDTVYVSDDDVHWRTFRGELPVTTRAVNDTELHYLGFRLAPTPEAMAMHLHAMATRRGDAAIRALHQTPPEELVRLRRADLTPLLLGDDEELKEVLMGVLALRQPVATTPASPVEPDHDRTPRRR